MPNGMHPARKPTQEQEEEKAPRAQGGCLGLIVVGSSPMLASLLRWTLGLLS